MVEKLSENEQICQLIYVSKAVKSFCEDDLTELLQKSRKNNEAIDITGALVYNKGYFLQLLEGKKETVEALFRRIAKDKRHINVSCFSYDNISERIFSDWYMGFFQHDHAQDLNLSNLINFYESEHPANQFFVEKLLKVRKKLNHSYHMRSLDFVKEIDWIIEEICSPSMGLIFDMVHDKNFTNQSLRLKLGLDSLSVGVIVTDMERNITYINHSAVCILGNTKDSIKNGLLSIRMDDLIGKNIDLFYNNRAHIIKILDELTDTIQTTITLGGRYLSIKVAVISDGFGERIGYMAEVEDITQREKNKSHLQTLNNQMNQMQRVESISRLTAGIAHDFNNILGVIVGYNQLNKYVANDCENEQLKEELLFNTDQVGIASERGIELIKKMMTYSRQNAVDKEIDVKVTHEVIDEVLSLMRPALTSIFKLSSIVDSSHDIQIDSTELHQILTNLIVNARDAMEIGGEITVMLKEKVIHEAVCKACVQTIKGKFVELTVLDNGVGIDSEVVNRIFEPFFTTKEVGEGTGLGLSTVSGMVHNADGHIIVESNTTEPNTGTAFQLLFPIC